MNSFQSRLLHVTFPQDGWHYQLASLSDTSYRILFFIDLMNWRIPLLLMHVFSFHYTSLDYNCWHLKWIFSCMYQYSMKLLHWWNVVLGNFSVMLSSSSPSCATVNNWCNEKNGKMFHSHSMWSCSNCSVFPLYIVSVLFSSVLIMKFS